MMFGKEQASWREKIQQNMLRKMNLQLFAEGAEGDAQAGTDGDTAGTGTGAAGASADGEKQTDQPKMLTQKEVDDLITRRLARAQRDEQTRINAAREEGIREGEQRAKMTDQQRMDADRERTEREATERETRLAERERAIMRRELHADAAETLVKRGLPRDLCDLLDYADEDACNASIDKVEKIYRASVQAGIDERIRKSGARVETGAGAQKPDYDKMSDEEYYKATYEAAKKKG